MGDFASGGFEGLASDITSPRDRRFDSSTNGRSQGERFGGFYLLAEAEISLNRRFETVYQIDPDGNRRKENCDLRGLFPQVTEMQGSRIAACVFPRHL